MSAGVATHPLAAHAGRIPLTQVLGIAPGMDEDRVRRILAHVGARIEVAGEDEAEEAGNAGLEREVWELRDPRYSWLQITFDARHHLRALQASLRPGGPGLRYAEIGDLRQARRWGYTIWEWEISPADGRPGLRIIARGADSEFASTVTLLPID